MERYFAIVLDKDDGVTRIREFKTLSQLRDFDLPGWPNVTKSIIKLRLDENGITEA